MEDNKVTMKDVLVMVIERLNDIPVPMKLKHMIADQIEIAVHDLQACVDAITSAEKEAEKQEEQNNEEPVIELVEVKEMKENNDNE